MNTDTDLRYPIGKFAEQRITGKELYNDDDKNILLRDVEFLPALIENEVLNLDAAQLNTPYRPGGWTVNQLVHHVADSHINAYTRFKLALTEENPTIKTYDEAAWAELSDSKTVPINFSLTLLHALHVRWYALMKNMVEADWAKTIFHPEHQRSLSLWQMLALYAWHGKHHVAHISSLKSRMGWR